MHKYSIALAVPLLILFPILSSFATTTIHGNPIGQRDDYTINSPTVGRVTVKCDFTNTGKTAAKLNIWTSPKQKSPFTSVNLPVASTIPSKVVTRFTLQLVDYWWCHIYLPHDKQNWQYCDYFSISDATLSKSKPFATWNNTNRSKHTQYVCTIHSKTNKQISFFKRKT